MFSINGIGTSLYGKSKVESDGSYIATKWFIFLLLPIVPLGSYRVQRGETTFSATALIGLPGANTKYKMLPVPLNWNQIIQTYLAVYGILALIILDLIFESNMYIAKSLLVIGFIYSIYYLFKTGKKWWAILLIISALVIGFANFV
jgi:hypothetical protein